nr:hypothetical protein [Clostridioides sp.]
MINETSPIADIAIEAKDTSDDVRQISMGIEASCKHIDHSVTSMPLSDVPKFIDDFPISDIEITPDMVGYGVDTKDNDYDVISINNEISFPGSQEILYKQNFGPNFSRIYPYIYNSEKLLARTAGSVLAFFSFNDGSILLKSNSPCQRFDVNSKGLISAYDPNTRTLFDVNSETLEFFNGRVNPNTSNVAGISFPNDKDIYLLMSDNTSFSFVKTEYGSSEIERVTSISKKISSPNPVLKTINNHLVIMSSNEIYVFDDKLNEISSINISYANFSAHMYKCDMFDDLLFVTNNARDLRVFNWKTGESVLTKNLFFTSSDDTFIIDDNTMLVCSGTSLIRYDLKGNLLFTHNSFALGRYSFILPGLTKSMYYNFLHDISTTDSIKITSNKETKLIAKAKKRGVI